MDNKTPSKTAGTGAAVGDADYSRTHVRTERAGAVVIDLAQARERLASLRGEQNRLTRRDTNSVGSSVPAHPKKSTPMPTIRHPLVEAVLPDRVAATLPSDGSPRSVGQLTHTAVAILSPTAHQLHPQSLVEATLVLCRAICPPGRQHRRTSTLVAGFTMEYLRGPLRPRPPWEFIGSEQRTDAGRVDLVWRHTDSGTVLFDEVKTTEVTRRAPDKKWLEQCVRYAQSGVSGHGDLFLGVRLLPLGSMNVASFVAANGEVLPLAPTWDDPLAGIGGASS